MEKNIIFLIIFFVFLLTPFITKGAVVINEVLYDPTGTDTGLEYIILYNNGDSPYSLTNHCLYASTEHYIFDSFSLGAKEKVIIHWNAEGSNTTTDLYTDKANWSNMGNSSGSMALFLNHTEHNKSTIIDFIRYHTEGSSENKTWESAAVGAEIWTVGDFIPNVEAGEVIKLKTDGQDNDSPSDWKQATPSISQGEEPDEPEEPEEEPQEPSQSSGSSSNQPPIANAGNDIIAFIDQEITFDGSSSRDPDGSELAYEWNLGEGGVKNDIIITHKYSYSGTYLVTLMVYDGRQYSKDTITVEIYPQKIFINEFLPSPVGKDAEEEWVELYNDSDQVADISGWQLDDEDGGSKPFTFPENTLIAPKSYLVFSRQTTKISLNNDSDKIRLLLSTGIIFQEVSYEKAPEGKSSAKTPAGFVWSTPTPGFPNIVSTKEQKFVYKGSLQSENTDQPSEDSTKGNWTVLSESKTKEPTSDKKNQQYDLANLGESTSSNNKLILIILTIALVAFAAVIGIIKLKKKY